MSNQEEQLHEVTIQSNQQNNNIPNSLSNSIIETTQNDLNKLIKPAIIKDKKLSKKVIIKTILTVIIITILLIYVYKNFEISRYIGDISGDEKRCYEGEIKFNKTLNRKYSYIQQPIDHFNLNDNRIFCQRIIINSQISNLKKDIPVFLYIPQLDSINQTQSSSLFNDIIKQKKGISITIQHRYFGMSLPFGSQSFTLNNLVYLNFQQIVEDVANAITKIIENRYFGITQKNVWIVNGRRIGGTITAWLKAKYPQLSNGAIASSPIQPTIFTPLISQKVYSKVQSGGKKCRIALQKIKQNLQQQLNDIRSQSTIYQISQGFPLSIEQILYIFQKRINQISKQQYLYLCQSSDKQSQLIRIFRQIILTSKVFLLDPLIYSSQSMGSQDQWRYYQIVRNSRAVWYLKCTQLGIFQISSNKKTFVSKSINQTFYRNRCEKIFGTKLWPNSTDLVTKFKPYMQTANNLLIIHGYYDIYLPYGLNGTGRLTETIVKKCLRCESSFDYAKYYLPAKQIDQILSYEKNMIEKWVKNTKK